MVCLCFALVLLKDRLIVKWDVLGYFGILSVTGRWQHFTSNEAIFDFKKIQPFTNKYE